MTYTKGQHTYSHFNQQRKDRYEHIAIVVATRHWENYLSRNGRKFKLVNNDTRKDGSIDYAKSDLAAVDVDTDKVVAIVECETKDSSGWRFITMSGKNGGLDIPLRKNKYIYNKPNGIPFFHYMVDSDKKEMYITTEHAFHLAINCKGHQGQSGISDSDDFQMPDHGCRKVQKYAKQSVDGNRSPEDFIRIGYPKRFCTHYRISTDGTFGLLSKPGNSK